jgi:uncharacterized protein YndB with AHSA1/START domain
MAEGRMLLTLHYEIRIAAPRERVWKTMLEHGTYETWTSAFTEGSTYEGEFVQGGRLRFLSPDGSGIVSKVAELRAPAYLSIRHLGMIHNGVEDLESEEVKSWGEAYERYTLDATADGTHLRVALDTTPQSAEMMNASWAQGLAALKALCER